MKNIILLCIAAVLLFGCSSAYKATSTPDDVYYSPTKVMKSSDHYDASTSSSEDSYLRMKVQNRYQWNAIDDYSYWNDSRYDFGYSCFPSREVLLHPYGSYFGLSFGFGYSYYYAPWYYGYSPYTTVVYYKNPKVYSSGGNTYLTAYKNGLYNNTNNKHGFGSLLNKAFSNINNSSYNLNNNSTRLNNNSTRTFNTTPSSSVGGRSGGFNSIGRSISPRSPR
jgi:hypothetical protein